MPSRTELAEGPVTQVDPEGKLGSIQLEPCGARVAVLIDEFEYKGSLIVPDQAQRPPTTGKILALGPDVPLGSFSVGDRIVFPVFAGTLIAFQNKDKFRILSIDEILAKVHSKEALDYTAA